MANVKNALRSKDFAAGVFFLAFGAFFFILGRGYSMGSARSMGPGYFPALLSVLLMIVGVSAILKSMFRAGEKVEHIAVSKLALVTLSMVAFAFSLRPLGLIAAIVLAVMISGLGSRKFRVGTYLLLSAGLAAGSSLVFVKFLGLPIPLIGTWLGGR